MNSEEQTPSIAVVYESMFGSTRRIAEAIADGIRPHRSVAVVPVSGAAELPRELEALIVGGPTHAHGMSRPESRAEAVAWAANDQKHLRLDAEGSSSGVREWIAGGPPQARRFAAFDTRVDMPRIFTGSAAAAIDKRLAKTRSSRLSDPMSFLVDRTSALQAGEIERARAWGDVLGAELRINVVG